MTSKSVLVLDSYYPPFLKHLYEQNPGLASLSYEEQRDALMATRFGTSDFYSRHLSDLGWRSEEVVINARQLQKRWLRENYPLRSATSVGATAGRRFKRWAERVVVMQVKAQRPDVLFIQDMHWARPRFLTQVRDSVGLIVGQIASALRSDEVVPHYDLILSSFPHFVDRFRSSGVESRYFRLGFDPTVLDGLGPTEKQYGATFVGSFSPAHHDGAALLAYVAERQRVDFWGYGVESLPPSSPIHRTYHGAAWALDMYRVFARSEVTLNRHVSTSKQFANNMRLYEATGVGTCLVTDHKVNIRDHYEPDREVVTYSSSEECLEKVRYLLDHPKEREAIAAAGQQRTLREHTYRHRMEELQEILNEAFKAGKGRPAGAQSRLKR